MRKVTLARRGADFSAADIQMSFPLEAAAARAPMVRQMPKLSAFLDRALFQVFARPLFDTNYWGYYILAFAGSALIAWGGCLIAAVRRPEEASGVGTATAVALIVGSIVRLLAWYSGEYRTADDPIRLEAGVLALVALAFVWLRPPRRDRA